jgi:putative DNA primase/helicase
MRPLPEGFHTLSFEHKAALYAERAAADATPAKAIRSRASQRSALRPKNDAGPRIRLRASDIERIVDEAEDALIRADRGLYQRDGRIVSVEVIPAIAAHGRKILIQKISERGDHALREDLSSAASFEKFDARTNDFVPTDPPLNIVMTLRDRGGRLRFPPLSGVINTPTIRADGSIINMPGYDRTTGLLFDPLGVDFPAIPKSPTKEDASTALALLDNLIATFPFVAEIDRAVALSAILTALIRRSLMAAPLHAYTATVAGTGKSMLVDVVSTIATGHEAGVIAQGADETELEKRLGAALIAGDQIIAVDNCDRPLEGQLLCQMLTQGTVKPRVLCKSENPTCSTGAFVAATGNNLILVGI